MEGLQSYVPCKEFQPSFHQAQPPNPEHPPRSYAPSYRKTNYHPLIQRFGSTVFQICEIGDWNCTLRKYG
jgi:hypothetical protein